ncbi:YbbR-like domain-containing protein [Lactobacillus sp. Sy-1]|uniref:CdaR family protein n=1 Tax=Lactobacillus sp. Sy-1 TaxID=2109645 RepID=UPI001C5B9955|nr:CdaR family protein [Lactobacillus sp. Sy-1]MBW1605930.1 cell surface protein [Lactobacillus sp. Sy-1]
MRKFFNSTFFYLILSFIFAILLYAYANQDKLNFTSDNNSNITKLASTKKASVSANLQLNVNSSKYFVTGYPDKVNVSLSGPTALVTTTTNTQNFHIYADLSKLGVGKHRVKLSQDGLNSELNYKINPSYITVNIQPRQTVSLPVSASYDKNMIASGYHVGKVVVSDAKVKATGASSEISKAVRVIAKLNLSQNTNNTVNSQAILEAVDRKGNTVNVILTPATTNVYLPISSGNFKELPIKYRVDNKASNKTYTITSSTKKVKVFGTSSELDGLNDVTVAVDVSRITSNQTKTVQLDKSLNKVSGFNPNKIKVSIEVKDK